MLGCDRRETGNGKGREHASQKRNQQLRIEKRDKPPNEPCSERKKRHVESARLWRGCVVRMRYRQCLMAPKKKTRNDPRKEKCLDVKKRRRDARKDRLRRRRERHGKTGLQPGDLARPNPDREACREQSRALTRALQASEASPRSGCSLPAALRL